MAAHALHKHSCLLQQTDDASAIPGLLEHSDHTHLPQTCITALSQYTDDASAIPGLLDLGSHTVSQLPSHESNMRRADAEASQSSVPLANYRIQLSGNKKASGVSILNRIRKLRTAEASSVFTSHDNCQGLSRPVGSQPSCISLKEKRSTTSDAMFVKTPGTNPAVLLQARERQKRAQQAQRMVQEDVQQLQQQNLQLAGSNQSLHRHLIQPNQRQRPAEQSVQRQHTQYQQHNDITPKQQANRQLAGHVPMSHPNPPHGSAQTLSALPRSRLARVSNADQAANHDASASVPEVTFNRVIVQSQAHTVRCSWPLYRF